MQRKLLVLCIVILGVLLAAQETKLIERTVAVFDFEPMSGSVADYSSLCADTIAIELERIGYTVLDTAAIRKAYKGSLLDDSAVIQFAKAQNADVVVMGFYIVEGASLHIGVRAIDILTGLIAVAIFDTGKGGVAVFDTIDEISARVAKRIRETLQPLPESELVVYKEIVKEETTVVEEVVEQGIPVTILVKSNDEGAEVYSGDTLLGVIEQGQLAIDTKEGAPLILTIKKPGFYTRTVNIKASSKKPQVKIRRLQIIANNEAAAFIAHDRPLGFNGLYSRAIFPDIFYYGGLTGFFFIPFDFNFEAPEHDTRAFFELPLYATLTFYPIGIFAPQYTFQPYIRAGIGGELYFSNFPNGFAFSAVAGRGIISLGLTVAPESFALTGEIQFVSTPFAGWGYINPLPPVIHLCIGVRLIW